MSINPNRRYTGVPCHLNIQSVVKLKTHENDTRANKLSEAF